MYAIFSCSCSSLADHTMCDYQTASAGFPYSSKNVQFQWHLVGICLFLLISAAWFNQNPLSQALADLCFLENSYFSHLDRISLRRTQECPELHNFFVAVVETGHELSLTVMGFNQADLTRSHVLNISLYWLQTPYMKPRAWLPEQGMWAWALCYVYAESWISSLVRWAQVCQIDYSTLCSMGRKRSLFFTVIWIMKSFYPLIFASFSLSCSTTSRRCQHWDLSHIQV